MSEPLDLFDPERLRIQAMQEAAAREFSEDRLCAAWLANGFGDREFWEHLRPYEQRSWLAQYREERIYADYHSKGRMRSAAFLAQLNEFGYQEAKRHAEYWARDLREAFVQRKPCPIIPEPRYRWILDWAFQLAQLHPDNLVAETKEETAA